mmetsp:Transcript_18465/g.16085  ORF Transcript_18465/g.16085 Transcript_18465/m.16085 type:complete len:183 (+) Transcript_18465:310-858(+)|eukprot:CAMPEP_0114585522 /NCGR_PEP_ID=MMETSP0125-20121206/9040_1 /TAXON_ID=485358 ORGANISM="Aristerostoma sp., Strain ATCC 50986" /NCGR_SAMPLE_ID=MMETSP0125 /ASSEMBLY_ACC=CAM_ASM_000245 /LENGTH=182 /DNA_ID=CAMNT_0001780633 /DNA_START=139 /DNA_END=687 /DNA_ORIENTATION=+
MIKIIGPKKNQNRVEDNKDKSKDPKSNPGYLRLTKDLSQIDIPRNAQMTFPNKDDITRFDVKVKPEEGSFWFGAHYDFSVTVPTDYPHEPPKIECNTKIYHPNIDLNGKVCLNILRQDWKPVLDINNVILGLLFLFIEPNPNDPLNEEAAEMMRKDKKTFADFVKKTLKGHQYKDVYFPKML